MLRDNVHRAIASCVSLYVPAFAGTKLLLGDRGMGCEQLSQTVARQCHGQGSNSRPPSCKSSAITILLLSHPKRLVSYKQVHVDLYHLQFKEKVHFGQLAVVLSMNPDHIRITSSSLIQCPCVAQKQIGPILTVITAPHPTKNKKSPNLSLLSGTSLP